jgi:hypothetical protein
MGKVLLLLLLNKIGSAIAILFGCAISELLQFDSAVALIMALLLAPATYGISGARVSRVLNPTVA